MGECGQNVPVVKEDNMQRFVIALLGALAFWAVPVLAASPEVIEGAKKDGEVVWYGGGSGEIDEIHAKNFSKKFPFLQVKKTRIQSQRLLVRFEAESKAGKHIADIVRTTDWYIDIFKQKGLLMKYESPERKAFINELKDRDGYYTALYKQLHAIAYNTRMVRKQDLPRSYDGLLDPKWKGQLGLEDAAYVWFVNLLKIKGESQGIEFMKKLARQNVSLRSGTTLLTNLVVAGEIPLVIDIYAYTVDRAKKSGAPIDFHVVEPAIVHTITGGISKNAPHPNAAKLFMDYLLSEEGQRTYLSQSLEPARTGMDPAWVRKGIKLYVNNPEIGVKIGYDLVLRGGRVVDGSGLPSYLADVAIKDGKIVEIGRVRGNGGRTIDVHALVVCPGFIDHHTHMDAQIQWDPYGTPEPEHGITSIVMGNDALALAPVNSGDEHELVTSFVRFEAMPRHALEKGIPWGWHSYRDYLDSLEGRLGINVGGLVGHIPLCHFVMGQEAADRPAKPAEIQGMKQLVAQAMEGGAL